MQELRPHLLTMRATQQQMGDFTNLSVGSPDKIIITSGLRSTLVELPLYERLSRKEEEMQTSGSKDTS